MTAVGAAKKALRLEVSDKLKALSRQEIDKQSLEVYKLLTSHPRWRPPLRTSVYLSTGSEVSTAPILSALFGSGSSVFVPQCEGRVMRMLRVRDSEDVASLPLTKWGIPEPAIGDNREDALKTGGLDLVIVPGVAFTKDGQRLGHGAGYYDTFLRMLQDIHSKMEPSTKPTTIALALKEQIYDSIPTAEHDFVVDYVISPL